MHSIWNGCNKSWGNQINEGNRDIVHVSCLHLVIYSIPQRSIYSEIRIKNNYPGHLKCSRCIMKLKCHIKTQKWIVTTLPSQSVNAFCRQITSPIIKKEGKKKARGNPYSILKKRSQTVRFAKFHFVYVFFYMHHSRETSTNYLYV